MKFLFLKCALCIIWPLIFITDSFLSKHVYTCTKRLSFIYFGSRKCLCFKLDFFLLEKGHKGQEHQDQSEAIT